MQKYVLFESFDMQSPNRIFSISAILIKYSGHHVRTKLYNTNTANRQIRYTVVAGMKLDLLMFLISTTKISDEPKFTLIRITVQQVYTFNECSSVFCTQSYFEFYFKLLNSYFSIFSFHTKNLNLNKKMQCIHETNLLNLRV